MAAAHANGGLGIAAAYGFGSDEEFADADASFPRTSRPDPDAEPPTDEDRIVALFR